MGVHNTHGPRLPEEFGLTQACLFELALQQGANPEDPQPPKLPQTARPRQSLKQTQTQLFMLYWFIYLQMTWMPLATDPHQDPKAQPTHTSRPLGFLLLTYLSTQDMKAGA